MCVLTGYQSWCNHPCLFVQAPPHHTARHTSDGLMQPTCPHGSAWSSISTVLWMMHHSAFTSGHCISQVSQMNSFRLNIFHLFYWRVVCRDHHFCITVDDADLHFSSQLNFSHHGWILSRSSEDCLLSAQDNFISSECASCDLLTSIWNNWKTDTQFPACLKIYP